MKNKLALLGVFSIIAVIAVVKIFGETVSKKFGSANDAVVSDVTFGGGSDYKSEAPSDRFVEVADKEEAPMEAKSKPDSKPKSKTWKRSNKDINLPTVFIGDNEQLPLKGSQISVKVDGFRARVLIDAFFRSNSERNLEGTFKMRLPQGATPHYLAFGKSVVFGDEKAGEPFPILDEGIDNSDVEEGRKKYWHDPKVARVVPKEKAAFAYGQTVRRRVDPALSEWAGADVFNFRVYPLEPKAMHRIVIGYDVNLTSINSDWVYNFPIPKRDAPLIVDFDVADIAGSPVGFEPKQKSRLSNGRHRLRLNNPGQGEVNVRYTGLKNAVLQHDEVGKYFGMTLDPEITSTAQSSVSENAIIALDLSLSSRRSFAVWLKLVRAILTNNRTAIRRFNVALFNIETSWWKDSYVENTPENVDAFLAYANSMALEGASDLNHLLSSMASAPWARKTSDNIFLLSDAADTWGEDDSYEMAKNINANDKLFAFNTGMSGTSVNNLNHLTRSSGGAVFAVNGEDEIEKASAAFRKESWKIEKISVKGGSDLLIAGRPKYLFEGQKLLISGRGMLAKGSEVKLNLSQNGAKKVLNVKVSDVLDSTLSKRVYGQMATGVLEEFGHTTETESIAYARHFRVPGKTSSLLMLESEADYARFKISLRDDGIFVSKNAVNQILDKLMKNIAKNLANSKNKFVAWLAKLSKTDGLLFRTNDDLKSLIKKTPESEFIVKQRPLSMRSKTREAHTSSFGRILTAPQLDYDKIVAESERRKEKYSKSDALKVLSSLVEKNPGNTTLSRDVAYSALEWEFNEQAYFLFRRILKQRPYEPQTYLAIAKALERSQNYELAMIYYEIVLNTEWAGRFGAFKRIASLDYLRFLSLLKKKSGFVHSRFAAKRHATLRKTLEHESADVMVLISWNTDNTDIDLHVIEPSGEECYYSHRNTAMGGQMTQDVTTGYGPEMYVLPNAEKGRYVVRAKYYSSDQNRKSTRTKVYATIYRNWGTSKESVSTRVVSLADNKDMHEIITFNVK